MKKKKVKKSEVVSVWPGVLTIIFIIATIYMFISVGTNYQDMQQYWVDYKLEQKELDRLRAEEVDDFIKPVQDMQIEIVEELVHSYYGFYKEYKTKYDFYKTLSWVLVLLTLLSWKLDLVKRKNE